MAQHTRAIDVAAYIVRKLKGCTHMKLQKLVYYSQAWSLVWLEKPLFHDPVEAWANGPVVPALYSVLRGQFQVSADQLAGGSAEALTEEQQEVVDKVIDFYGKHDPQWLSDLTHAEDPWIQARKGLPAGERGHQQISQASMAEYYSGLPD
jgi:uncharacterized phage-associated protein